MKFNWLDLILMLIAFRGVYTGYRRGILGELVFIAGSFASFFFAYKYSALLGDHLAEQISLDIASSHNFCFWSVVFGGLLASLILGRLMMRLSRILFDSVSDKLVGSIAGLLRALLFGGVLLLCIQTQFVTFKSNIDDSALGAYVISATEKCSLWVKQFAGESVTPVESQGEEIESEKIPETVPASGEDIEENDEATAGVERIPWL